MSNGETLWVKGASKGNGNGSVTWQYVGRILVGVIMGIVTLVGGFALGQVNQHIERVELREINHEMLPIHPGASGRLSRAEAQIDGLTATDIEIKNAILRLSDEMRGYHRDVLEVLNKRNKGG